MSTFDHSQVQAIGPDMPEFIERLERKGIAWQRGIVNYPDMRLYGIIILKGS